MNIFKGKCIRILGPVYKNKKENWRILTNKEIYALVKTPTLTETISSFIDTNLIHNFLYKLHKIKVLYMFRASSAHLQGVNDVNCTCMQPLVFSFSAGGRLVHMLRGDCSLDCPETSVTNYHYRLCNSSEDSRSQLMMSFI